MECIKLNMYILLFYIQFIKSVVGFTSDYIVKNKSIVK